MDETRTETRGPVTPPLDPENHNGTNDEVNNYDMNDELDLTAQQEMQTPSPVNEEEYELMAMNNELVQEISESFVDTQDKPDEKLSSPTPQNISPSENQPIEEEGELEEDDKSPPSQDDKKAKKKKHRKHSVNEDDKSNRKRRHSDAKNDEKSRLEKLKEMKFVSTKMSGQDTRRFNFRETAESKAAKETPKKERIEPTNNTTPLKKTPLKERRRSPDPNYRSETITHPIMNTFRELRSLPFVQAVDKLFSINAQDVANLSKSEMIEILDLMFELNKRRETLTINRVRLTDESRMICDNEISLLTNLEHLMNPDDRNFFSQLKQCPPSMDELVEFNSKILCTDVELSKGSIRLHPVDLLPPSNTPMIGRHDPNYDGFTKLVPPQFHGIAPPTQSAPQNEFNKPPPQQQPQQSFAPNLAQPPPNFASMPPPQNLSIPPPAVPPQSSASASFQQPISQPTFVSQAPTSTAPPIDFSLPPPNLAQSDSQGFKMEPMDMPIVSSSGPPMIQLDQPPPSQLIPPITSHPPPNIGELPNFPPPKIVASMAPPSMDLSVPPPIMSNSIAPMGQPGEQLSPVSAFRNSLRSSFLNTLASSGQPPPLSGPPPGLPDQFLQQPPPASSLAFLHQPPPSLAGSSASPQRFAPSMPSHSQSPHQGPYPLMSFKTENPYQKPHQRHGKSPSFRSSGGDKQNQRRGGGRAIRKHRNDSSPSSQDLTKQFAMEDIRASESPASSISQTTTAAATVATSTFDPVERADTNTEPSTPK